MSSPKITFVGAGSTVFAKNLLGDILSFPELAEATLSLFDIDADRLATSEVVARRVAETLGVSPTIEATTDRSRALDGADYAISMFQVAGYEPGTVIDFEIPRSYGLRQTIGDTLGIGGIIRALRTIPVFLELAAEMEQRCPRVRHLNYVNPMAMNCWALDRATSIDTVGLCHSVQGTAQQLARDISIPIDEIEYRCAGINHMAFYLAFTHHGRDLTPDIQRVIDEDRVPDWNRVRYELFRRFGHFVTESSEHFAEYVPWFIKSTHPELLEQFNIPIDEYLRRCRVQITAWDFMRRKFEDPDIDLSDEYAEAMRRAGVPDKHIPIAVYGFEHLNEVNRSDEYGSLIIHSLETGQPRTIYGNVRNGDLIANLPEDCCVEVPCRVDGDGIHPEPIGSLPPQLAALIRTNVNVQELTVEAVLTGEREHVYHAALLDPHTAAELSVDEIVAMVDDLIEAHGDWIPDALRVNQPSGPRAHGAE